MKDEENCQTDTDMDGEGHLVVKDFFDCVEFFQWIYVHSTSRTVSGPSQ